MLRKFIFKYGEGSEYILPISPKSFKVDYGIRVETVNIHTMGDVNIAGYSTLSTISIDCMFPSKNIIRLLWEPIMKILIHRRKCLSNGLRERTKLRFVVSDTTVNLPVVVENITLSEQDGTNDIYASIKLRQVRELNAIQTEDAPVEETPPHMDYYTVVWGDTMWDISYRYYGDATLCWKLASYNGIANANLIYPGQVVTIPDRSLL
ncbi:MAG: LysM peptidoglycan-binding domain-containing protein [Eubacteriales bacterium]